MTSSGREQSGGGIDGASVDGAANLEDEAFDEDDDLEDEEFEDDEDLDGEDEEFEDDEDLDGEDEEFDEDEELEDDEDDEDEEFEDDEDLDDEDDEDLDDEEEEFEDDEDLDDGAGDGRADDAEYEAGDVNTISAPAGHRGEPGPGRGDTAVGVLEYLARSMADDPDAVVIRKESRRGSTILRLHVAPHDMGRIIGRRGRTAQAIRTLVAVAGASDGVQTLVDIADD